MYRLERDTSLGKPKDEEGNKKIREKIAHLKDVDVLNPFTQSDDIRHWKYVFPSFANLTSHKAEMEKNHISIGDLSIVKAKHKDLSEYDILPAYIKLKNLIQNPSPAVIIDALFALEGREIAPLYDHLKKTGGTDFTFKDVDAFKTWLQGQKSFSAFV